MLVFHAKNALKGANETVSEGMSSMGDIHAGLRRHLNQAKYVHETCIHWNGPPLPNAEPLLRGALTRHFGGPDWHFKHNSNGGRRVLARRIFQGLVLLRKREELNMVPLYWGRCKCRTPQRYIHATASGWANTVIL